MICLTCLLPILKCVAGRAGVNSNEEIDLGAI